MAPEAFDGSAWMPGVSPYNAGMRRVVVDGVASATKLPLTIWYPTLEAEKRQRCGGMYTLSHARAAKPAGKGLGLVVFSHGSGGSDINHHDWAETLARHGYVVVSPRHVGDSPDLRAGVGADVCLVRRVRQLSDALDAALAFPELSGRIDPRRIGAFGFSAGGFSVLALLGGTTESSVLATPVFLSLWFFQGDFVWRSAGRGYAGRDRLG